MIGQDAVTLEPAKAHRVELEDVFKAYDVTCKRDGLDVLTPEQFIGPLQRFCHECGIATQSGRGGKVYLLNVRIVGTTLGEMT